MAKRPSMGRQKIEIKKIENIDARQVCFSKRRSGLFKKASELCILCGVEVAIIVFSPAGKVFSFGHHSVDSVIQGFLADGSGCRSVASPADQGVAMRERELYRQYEKMLAQLEAEKKKKEKLEKAAVAAVEGGEGWWNKSVEELEVEELEEFGEALEELRKMVVRRSEVLVNGPGWSGLALPAQLGGARLSPPIDSEGMIFDRHFFLDKRFFGL